MKSGKAGKRAGKKDKAGEARKQSAVGDAIEVRESGIHGRGLFAAKKIRRGDYIATFEGKRTTKDGPHVLWSLDEDGNEVGVKGRNELRFLNHSREPNAEFIGLDLIATRKIERGAELTIHYGEAWEDVE